MKRIIISRTDSIGDVVLTLPLAVALKKRIPNAYILFLGQKYTEPVIRCCSAVDEFIDAGDVLAPDGKDYLKRLEADAMLHVFPKSNIASTAKSAGIPLRVGTSHRLYHFWT